MARSRHCDVCNGWHDVEQSWPQKCIGHFKRLGESNRRSAHVMGDIEPYKNVVDGKVIGGRKQHRDFLKARGLVEVGNEKIEKKYEAPVGVREDIKRAIDEVGGL
jgi:hypothetical protein